ncbi:mechanosensitive ion channel family protein [Putridiphycobacter roseus]|uniref:Mechanosensitive ion channel family protein n=1 Tax=Putridiphycobacter roseus TaxID=2219161 RepID=A0A2W1N1T2_9FLAO|nr:mechanosensitive ion channel domain-containing protein [Putridiphycobacter roseus]PZE17520.1 mechanosensitive ion channel family protein [Putridiphycobacter roseus]
MDMLFLLFPVKEPWLKNVLSLLVLIGIGLFLQWLIFRILRFGNRRNPSVLKSEIIKHLKVPTRFFLPFLFVYGSLTSFEISVFWKKVIEAFVIINFTWILIAFIQGVEVVVREKFQIEGSYKVKERKVLTQLRFLKSLAFIVIITLAVAAILWNIPAVKKVGTTILTSAGVIGIIVGVAAQKSIANLITGFQIAFTQSIKIDDEVVIEGEFGQVEDITLTNVVVKLWDWRTLVIPLSYFNDHTFVNWTFNSTDIIGTVFLYVDYSLPVEAIRKELLLILSKQNKWDGNVAKLLVTKTDHKVMELRATFSAKNPSDVWDLRCSVREELIAFIGNNYPDSLPKLRKMDVRPI